ncbi:hypothetical protein VC33_12605 [Pseudomonas fluorescens]|nr:hypothetical protein VC33_12605 [Pseudomonas fluorescens]
MLCYPVTHTTSCNSATTGRLFAGAYKYQRYLENLRKLKTLFDLKVYFYPVASLGTIKQIHPNYASPYFLVQFAFI